MTGFPRANPTENEHGSGYISTSAAADGADSCKDEFPHTPQPEAEYGSGYGLDPAAATGASGVSARFPHTQTPSNDRKRRKHQPPQLETGEGPAKIDTPEAGTGTLKFSQVSPAVSLLGANLSDKQTFEEEKLLDMVEGPFTKQEAANRCRCSPTQLCPGPMAAIDGRTHRR